MPSIAGALVSPSIPIIIIPLVVVKVSALEAQAQ
jgi:hypothetical protein